MNASYALEVVADWWEGQAMKLRMLEMVACASAVVLGSAEPAATTDT